MFDSSGIRSKATVAPDLGEAERCQVGTICVARLRSSPCCETQVTTSSPAFKQEDLLHLARERAVRGGLATFRPLFAGGHASNHLTESVDRRGGGARRHLRI
jgi:hypothetical protein